MFFCSVRQIDDEHKWGLMSKIMMGLGMTAMAQYPTNKLTDYQQLKLATAIALLGAANVLIFDNPTYEIAIEDKREFWDILARLKTKRALFLTTIFIEEIDVSVYV